MEVIIRDMKESDSFEIANIEKLCFSIPWSEESFINEANNPLAKYFIAELDGKIIGYVGMWKVLDEGHITNVAVHPDYRRRRIGFKLIDSLMCHAKNVDISFIILEVRVSNVSAQNLYKKFGFDERYIRKGYYVDNNEDAIIMQVDIINRG